MDRRQYLGLTGAGIAALLGGCSSSDGGGSSDEGSTPTYTSTPFRNETGTPTPVGTPTPKITDTPTTTPTATATPTSTPEPGKELQQKAADLGLSIRAVRWLDQEQTPDEEYGLNDSQIDHILNAEPGMQLERAVEILDGEDYTGSLGNEFDQPSKEITDQAAEDLRAIFQNDLGRYNTVYPQSRVFAHRGIPSHSIVAVNEDRLSMAHPLDKLFNENRVGNTSEIFDYSNGETSSLTTKEDYIASAWLTRKVAGNPGVLPTYDLTDWESASIHHENASSAQLSGLNEAFGNNLLPVDQGERDSILLKMYESGNKVLAHYGKPEMRGDVAEVTHAMPWLKLADAIDEQTEYDPYMENGIPDHIGFRVGSQSEDHEDWYIESDHVDNIDFTERGATIE